MNKKVSLLIVSIILALIVFGVSTYLQKQLVNYVPTIKCLIANKDVAEYSSLSEEDFIIADMPIAIVANTKIAQKYSDIEDLFLKSDVYKGQILLLNQFDTKENLSIIRGEDGKEKIAIKVKSSENGTSYILKKGSQVNVYATFSNEYANSDLFKDYIKTSAGSDEYGYTTIKVLDNVKILGCFDENGENVENLPEKNIDTVLISVLQEDAYKINLIRDIATFNITEL